MNDFRLYRPNKAFIRLGVIQKCLVVTGVTMLLLSMVIFTGIFFGFVSIADLAVFDQSGLRIVAGVSVAGCLLAAIGFANQ